MVSYANRSGVAQSGTDQRTGGPARAGQAKWRRRLIVLFVFLFALPLEPILADQMLSGTRLFVLLTFVPFLLMTLFGQVGRLTVTDWMMFGFSLWIVLTLFHHYGAPKLPFAVITIIELLGGYLAGRVLVRSAEDYRWFFRSYFFMLLILLPFAGFEMLTGRPMLSEILSSLARVTPRNVEIRNNVFRAGVSYPHPIHWGLVSTLMFAQAWVIWRDQKITRSLRAFVAVACTLTAMSSAPLLALGVQIGLIVWGKLTGNRWVLLVTLFVTVYVALDLLSNRGPVILFIETMTLDSGTAWWRVYIWQFGSLSVMNHPIYGIGLEDWERPEWLAGTVDNFWLLTAMRYGLPAIVLLVLGLAWALWKITRLRDLSEPDKKIREAYMIGFVALCFALSTVHAWGAPSVLVMFYFGMSAYLYSGGAQPIVGLDESSLTSPEEPNRHLPYSRFPKREVETAKSSTLQSDGRQGKPSSQPSNQVM